MNTTEHTPAEARLPLRIMDLGRMAYAPAWEVQQQVHESLLADPAAPPVLILVEHDPVITVSQRSSAAGNLLASPQQLTALGIDVQPTGRGGDITYHGPGQLVAYPILRLATYHLNVGRYMRLLENAVVATLARTSIPAHTDPAATGVWVQQPGSLPDAPPPSPAKICAMGIRVRRNITLHGLALNVTTDLSHFDTIIPCGLSNRAVTSIQKIKNTQSLPTPTMDQVKQWLVESLQACLDRCD